FARVLGAAYAAESLEHLGELDAALTRYRESLSVWTPDLGDSLNAGGHFWAERLARLETEPGTVTREDVGRRVDQLSTFLTLPGGRDLERGRWLQRTGQQAETIGALDK